MAVAWLSLDETDGQPMVFWRYILAALLRVRPAFGEPAQAMLAAPTPAIETILAALINDLATLGTPLLLILDDYHLIQSAEIHRGLGFLLDHLPTAVHLLVLSAAPPLGLARRRARRQMVKVRGADLRFAADEASAFLSEECGWRWPRSRSPSSSRAPRLDRRPANGGIVAPGTRCAGVLPLVCW